ncbi:hypothetical protein BayCH28_09845 [Mycolicibacterium sp. CH28]|jgi:hypothetical protein|uniref:hypothetical protein n=1 Tax=Mycolicibacterium sp. CH28 TaxID=2512237 RepID=UPI001081B535|nr:hypothetical protein [Mycolicibacterium sp. CH28]TGD88076.1 hypothetical protein BayCH28_09845 [Mycolicibacterium sp. CH28]
MSDHVIFRYDPDHQPEITFRAVPSGCTGGANTMAEARACYRTCLSARLHVDRRALPTVVEHLEGLVCGMWVRTKVGAVHRDQASDRMLLQTLLSPGEAQRALRDDVAELTDKGAQPIVVLAEPDQPVEFVVDQMLPRDTLVVAHSDGQGGVAWTTLYGPESSDADGVPRLMDDSAADATPVAALTRSGAGLGLVVRRRRAADIAS